MKKYLNKTKKIKRYSKKKRLKKTIKNKRLKIKKGGQIENENYNLKIINIAENCIENLHLIFSLLHPKSIDNELNKFNNYLEDLINYLQQNSTTFINNEKLYDFLKSSYEKHKLKVFHFNDNKKYTTSSLLFINIVEEEILLMKRMIELINKIPCLPHSYSKEIDTIKIRYKNICDEFISQLPCLEQFVTTIFPRVIKPLEDLLEKCNNVKDNNKNLEYKSKNNIKEQMNLGDFHYDGAFAHYYNPTYELHQYILLSLLSFQNSLCNNINNCNENNKELINAYNENNYKVYLDYIHFFNNEKFKTIGISWNELKKIFESYLLDLPNSDDFNNEKICCLSELKDKQQQIIGGKKKK